jgi:hypothetical protein
MGMFIARYLTICKNGTEYSTYRTGTAGGQLGLNNSGRIYGSG